MRRFITTATATAITAGLLIVSATSASAAMILPW